MLIILCVLLFLTVGIWILLFVLFRTTRGTAVHRRSFMVFQMVDLGMYQNFLCQCRDWFLEPSMGFRKIYLSDSEIPFIYISFRQFASQLPTSPFELIRISKTIEIEFTVKSCRFVSAFAPAKILSIHLADGEPLVRK